MTFLNDPKILEQVLLPCVVVVNPVQDFVSSEILDLLVDELIEFPSPGP